MSETRVHRAADAVAWRQDRIAWDDCADFSAYAMAWAVAGVIRKHDREEAQFNRAAERGKRAWVRIMLARVEAGEVDLSSINSDLAEAILRQQRRNDRRTLKGLPPVAPVDREAAERASDARKLREELVRRRLALGFIGGNCVVGGRWVGDIHEAGLRTDDSYNLRVFVQRVPKLPLVGATKGKLVRCDSKLRGLDELYVAFNKSFWSMFRVDIDRRFESWPALRKAISDRGLPLPHIVVADVDPRTGEVIHPHLIWHLPYGCAVWNAPEDPRCRTAPRDFFKGVHKALVHALIPIGADPGCLSNPHHGKNPLCPIWHVVDDWNTTIFLTLTDWRDLRDCVGERVLDTYVKDEVVHRLAVIEADARPLDPVRPSGKTKGGRKAASNVLFTEMRKVAWRTLSAWREAGTDDYKRGLVDRSILAEKLKGILERHGRSVDSTEAQILYTAERVSSYAAFHWSDARVDRARNIARGRDLHETDLTEGTRTRQARAGRRSAEARAEGCRQEVLTAMQEASANGKVPTAAELAETLRMSPTTVRKHLRAAGIEPGTRRVLTASANGNGLDGSDPTVGGALAGHAKGDGLVDEVSVPSRVPVPDPGGSDMRDGSSSKCRFLSIHRLDAGTATDAAEVPSSVDSAPPGATGPVTIDQPDPSWLSPQPALPSSSPSTSVASAEPRGERVPPSPPRSASWGGARRPLVPSRPGSPTSSSSSTPTSSSSNSTMPEGEAERRAWLSEQSRRMDAALEAWLG